MKRDGFVFYRSFYEAIACLDKEQKADCLDAVAQYALDGVELETDGIVKALFISFKPQIDANNRRYENGCKGGKPKHNQNVTKVIPNTNQSDTKDIPKEKDKEKDKDKDKEKVKEVKTAYGEYAHVKLTKTEYQKMISDFGQDKTDKAIKFFDEYIEDKGYKSKSHNLAMRRWVFKAVEEQEQKQGVANGRGNNITISAPNSRQRADYEEVDKLLWG